MIKRKVKIIKGNGKKNREINTRANIKKMYEL